MRAKYLIPFLLLLTVSTLSAQERNSTETLRGLEPIGLIVRYGQVDGLDPAERPMTLRLLEDRAKGWLKGAKVPLLQSSNEAGNGPTLTFTITFKKPTDPSPQLLIEGRLYQRVRLLRDTAKEMKVPTWSLDVGAPEASTDLLTVLFEKQLVIFTRAYQAANPVPARIDGRGSDPPARPKANANALQGLNGVKLLISPRFIETAERRDQPGAISRLKDPAFSRLLQTEAENKLKQAGITLLRNETERPGRPRFEVFVTLGQPDPHAPAIQIGAALWQDVQLVSDPSKTSNSLTWEDHAVGDFDNSSGSTSAKPEDAVLKILNAQIEQFIKAFKAANP